MQIVMGWPELIVFSFLFLDVWAKIVKLTKFPNVFATRVGYALGIISYVVAWLSLLYWGGFFS